MLDSEKLSSSRFFFHLVSDEEVIRDTDGISLSVHGGVPLCVARAIEELRHEGFFAAGGGWQGWQIEITDDTGQTVLRVSLGGAHAAARALAVH